MNNKIKNIYFLSFLFTLHTAVAAYINSSFLAEIIKEDYVGLLYTAGSLLIIIILSKSSMILKNFGNKNLTFAFLGVNMLALLGLALSKNPYIIMGSFVVFMTTNTLVFYCIDIFIEHFSKDNKTGLIRGLYLTIVNMAYLLSPLLAAYLIAKGNYKAIYIFAFILSFIMAIGLVFYTKHFKDKKYEKGSIIDALKNLRKQKDVYPIVIINFLLQFFYAWMVVYTPIYLHQHLGFNWNQIGLIFSIMLIPFVIFGLPIGVLVDKYKVNKKILLYIGFFIIGITTSLMAFVSSLDVLIWGIVLFGTRVGASIIETTSEIYFFEKISDKDVNLISIFRDMLPVAYILAPIVATIIFFFIPFNGYFFLILGIIMFSGFYYIYQIKNGKNRISYQDK